MAAFSVRERYVFTRNGTFLVRGRELDGVAATIVTAIRTLFIAAGFVLVVAVSVFVPKQDELRVGFLGASLSMLGLLSFVPWRSVATKVLARRYDWIAGKPALYSIVAIKVNS